MAASESSAAKPSGKPDLLAFVDHISVSPGAGGARLVITMTVALELDDANALDLTLKVVDALARMRAGGAS